MSLKSTLFPLLYILLNQTFEHPFFPKPSSRKAEFCQKDHVSSGGFQVWQQLQPTRNRWFLGPYSFIQWLRCTTSSESSSVVSLRRNQGEDSIELRTAQTHGQGFTGRKKIAASRTHCIREGRMGTTDVSAAHGFLIAVNVKKKST